MKIFWRIFMRQISLTDYFCKGLGIFYMGLTAETAAVEIIESLISRPALDFLFRIRQGAECFARLFVFAQFLHVALRSVPRGTAFQIFPAFGVQHLLVCLADMFGMAVGGF